MHLLLNWLVHGTALTLVVALGVRRCQRMTAATRERIWRAAAVGLTLMPVGYLLADRAAATSALVSAARSDPPVTVQGSWNDWTTLLCVAWAGWMVVSLARCGLSLAQLRRSKQSAQPFPPDREARLPMWTAMRTRGRRARLVVSPCVHRAGVLGLGRPMIAVAPDTIARLTDEELDQIVLHEHAHIQRRDDLVILAQQMITALAGLHPAVRWLDRALTLDREVACDDWVVAYTGARTRYAQCLVSLAGPDPAGRRSLVPGAVRSRSQLSIRVAALLDFRRVVAIAPSPAMCRLAPPTMLALVAAAATMPVAGVVHVRPAEPLRSMSVAASAILESVPEERGSQAVPRMAPGLSSAPPDAFHPSPAGWEQAAGGGKQTAPSRETRVVDVHEMAETVQALPAATQAPIAVSLAPVGGRVEIDSRVERDPPWRAAADAGVAIGAGSRFAARKAGAAFTRFGKSFANQF